MSNRHRIHRAVFGVCGLLGLALAACSSGPSVVQGPPGEEIVTAQAVHPFRGDQTAQTPQTPGRVATAPSGPWVLRFHSSARGWRGNFSYGLRAQNAGGDTLFSAELGRQTDPSLFHYGEVSPPDVWALDEIDAAYRTGSATYKGHIIGWHYEHPASGTNDDYEEFKGAVTATVNFRALSEPHADKTAERYTPFTLTAHDFTQGQFASGHRIVWKPEFKTDRAIAQRSSRKDGRNWIIYEGETTPLPPWTGFGLEEKNAAGRIRTQIIGNLYSDKAEGMAGQLWDYDENILIAVFGATRR